MALSGLLSCRRKIRGWSWMVLGSHHLSAQRRDHQVSQQAGSYEERLTAIRAVSLWHIPEYRRYHIKMYVVGAEKAQRKAKGIIGTSTRQHQCKRNRSKTGFFNMGRKWWEGKRLYKVQFYKITKCVKINIRQVFTILYQKRARENLSKVSTGLLSTWEYGGIHCLRLLWGTKLQRGQKAWGKFVKDTTTAKQWILVG